MSSTKLNILRLFRLALRSNEDVVVCRQQARAVADAFGIPSVEQVKIATAVSEIARNAIQYAREGVVEFSVERNPAKLVFVIADQGEGIPHLSDIMAGRFISRTGMGRGIVGARRLMDGLDIETSETGTRVRMVKGLSDGALSEGAMRKASEKIARAEKGDVLEELAQQNRELLTTLQEVRAQREELTQRNHDLEQLGTELAETNQGVLALYDELDSLHRLGRIIASHMDLSSLLRSVIEATTELSNAEAGTFFHFDPQQENLQHRASTGILKGWMKSFPTAKCHQLFGSANELNEVLHIGDLEEANASELLASQLNIRSYIAVPVLNAHGTLAAAMVFGHRAPHRFGERTQRILGAIATQAAIGMENARLYTSMRAASIAKDHFLATLSHELRTPLNPVFVVLSGLELDTRLPEDIRQDLCIVRRNLELEARLIDDLLDMTRIVKGKIALKRETIHIHELLEAVCQTCSGNSEAGNVDIQVQWGASQHFVDGDPVRLQQVFWNLLNNAIKFTPADGRILIRTLNTPDAESIVVEVIDNGRGIETDMLKLIFHAFEQGNVAGRAEYNGLGLGLAISKTIVEAHGGEIDARSDGSGMGATFTVKLKVVSAPEPVTSSPPSMISASLVPQLRILLVDDHEDTLNTLRRLLIRRGHQVFIASNADYALAIAASEPIDLVVSDVGLPGRSGHELMAELKAKHGLDGIALSGFGADADIARSLAAGFFAHFTKPLDFTAFESILQERCAPQT